MAASSRATGRRCVRFRDDGSDNQVLELPGIDDSERSRYWYSREELSLMPQTAMVETAESLREARLNGTNTYNNDNAPTLRGLEGLSQASQRRKEEAEVERVRIIQAYSKQYKQGLVDEDSIRALYLRFNEIDTKRALAYGQLDARDSYCYNNNNNHPSMAKKSGVIKGMWNRIFHTPNKRKGTKK